MHDVLPKLQVGVLNFELLSSPPTGEETLNLDDRFSGELSILKLTISESGVIADSGIVLKGKDEIAIVAGGFPLTLALRGIEFDSPASDPEYPWDDYERSAL